MNDVDTDAHAAEAPLYKRLAAHYREAIKAGSLQPGERLPSLRTLMRLHDVSLSTALQLCRLLESEGWTEARDRSGYFVRRPQRVTIEPMDEPAAGDAPDPAQYVGVHARVSQFVERGREARVRVNFSVARAAPDSYPTEELRSNMTRALRMNPEMLAKAPPPMGDPHFREVLAKRAVANGMTLAPDDILVTNGCIEALNLALRAVAHPGDTIAVESPTFYGLLQILETLGLRALEIPTSPQTGISLEALELAIETYGDIRAVVVVPHLQNPLGSVMPDSHKERLVQLCDHHKIALIEDDTYSDLVDVEVALRSVKSWDHTGNVIYCASLHKTLAPGMRLGWMTAGRWHARVQILKYSQTRNTEALSQVAAGLFMATGAFDRHLRRLRATLIPQRERIAESIATYFPAGTRMNLPNGGLQVWVELPASCSIAAVFDSALSEGILIAPGFLFSNSTKFNHFMRVNCGWPYSHEIDRALRRTGEICAMHMA
ncbi:PLP-dependent aminotransferase family protein [soil metagenome]